MSDSSVDDYPGHENDDDDHQLTDVEQDQQSEC